MEVMRLVLEKILEYLKEKKDKKFTASELMQVLSVDRGRMFKILEKIRSDKLANYEHKYDETKAFGRSYTLYWCKDSKLSNNENAVKDNIEILPREIEQMFNSIYFRIKDLNKNAGKLLEELKNLETERDKIKVSSFYHIENYHNKDKLRKGVRNLQVTIRKLKAEKI